MFVSHVEITQTIGPLFILLVVYRSPWWVRVCIQVVLLCLDLQWKSYWILSNIFIENLIKSKLKFLVKLSLVFVLLESNQQVGFCEGDSVIFRPKLWEIYWGRLFVCCVENSQITTFFHCVLGIIPMPSVNKGCTKVVSYFLDIHLMKELLNIEQFYHWKFNKAKFTNFREIGASSLYCLKALDDWEFMEAINLKLKMFFSQLGCIVKVLFTLGKNYIVLLTLGLVAHATPIFVLKKVCCLVYCSSCWDLQNCKTAVHPAALLVLLEAPWWVREVLL